MPTIPLRSRLLLAVFIGGAIGTTLRAAGAELWPPGPGDWPWPTFAANLIGALALGFVAEWWAEHHDQRSLLGGGLCGGLTTFSTMQLELLRMLDHDELALAAGYAAASLTAGVLLARAGRWWADHPHSPRRRAG